MGAKTCLLAYADSDARAALLARPTLDRDATARLAAELFPRGKLVALPDGDLGRAYPPRSEICIGRFAGVSLVAAREIGRDRPSTLPPRFVAAAGSGTITLVAMHSVVDWFAYALWRNGELVRSLSMSPDNGVIEEIGARMPFEAPFWAGEHPVEVDKGSEPYPLPFHPLDFGEVVLAALLGFQLEGMPDPTLIEPGTVPLLRYRIRRPLWKLW